MRVTDGAGGGDTRAGRVSLAARGLPGCPAAGLVRIVAICSSMRSRAASSSFFGAVLLRADALLATLLPPLVAGSASFSPDAFSAEACAGTLLLSLRGPSLAAELFSWCSACRLDSPTWREAESLS